MNISEALAQGHGVLRAAEHRELRSAITRAATAGHLVRPVPGVACLPEVLETAEGLLRVAHAWQPSSIVFGRAAAWLWWGDEFPPHEVRLHGSSTRSHGVFHIDQVTPASELVTIRHGLLVTNPHLTVLDNLEAGHRDVLHQALRTHRTSLSLLHETLELAPRRVGNATIRAELRRAQENPWSGGEDDLHEFLREFHFTGWHGNYRVPIRSHIYYLDVAFPAQRLALEYDGALFHSSPQDRARDAARRADLASQGGRVVVITGHLLQGMMREHTAQNLHAALRQRALRRDRGLRSRDRG